MGAGVSVGENNDDLIDKLKEAKFIKTSSVEKVFRAVDRGAYFLPDSPVDAYRDVAWKNGNYHISAPCIYSEVMEGLKLKPGLSFLNLGSGTGYLNTVAGLILGSHGINHGIELYEDVIQYAYLKLEEFKKHSGAMDEFDFCEPMFIQGNCLRFAGGFRVYDRVYCGAACPEKYLSHLKNLVKDGGTLIVPMNEELLAMRKITENYWSSHCLLPVSFTNLVSPTKESPEIFPLFEIEPLSLQDSCRVTIRNILRKSVEVEHPEVRNVKRTRKAAKKKKSLKRDCNSKRYSPGSPEDVFDSFLLSMSRRKNRTNASSYEENIENTTSSPARRQLADDADNDDSTSENEDPLGHMQDVFSILRRFQRARPHLNPSTSTSMANPPDDDSETNETEDATDDKVATVVIEFQKKTAREGSDNESVIIIHKGNIEGIEPDQMVVEEYIPEAKNKDETKRKNKTDEAISECVDKVETVSSSSDDECKSKKKNEKRSNSKWRKIDRHCDEDSSDNESEYVKSLRKMKMYVSPYTVHMENKIQQLPLPSNVKRFLRFYKEF